MDMVRKEMGDDAIIVSTQPGVDGRGARVTAALDEPPMDDPAPTDWPDERETPESVGDEIRDALAFHGIPKTVAEPLLRTAETFEADGSVMALAGALDAQFGFAPFSPKNTSRPLMLVGPPGVGKTIAIAKLATRSRRNAVPATVVTTDTRRAGGIEQLQAFTRILGIDLITADTAADLVAAVATRRDTLVLIDTAGTNPFSDVEMESLAELVRAVEAEPVLVLPAGVDPMEAAEIALRFNVLGPQRLLATRLDLSRRLGGVLAAAEISALSFCEVSISPHVADGLTPINPVSLARLLLPHGAARSSTPHMTEATL
jgi:flagellar biosynthesis protein FlhF